MSVRLQQLAGVVLAVIFIDLGYRAYIDGSPNSHFFVVLSIVSYLLAFTSVFGIFDTPRRWLSVVYPAFCTIALVVGFVVVSGNASVLKHYSIDEVAYDHYSAQLLLQGRDPYVADMRPALSRFSVPVQRYTLTQGGGVMKNESYPALAFLVYAPFVAAHMGSMIPVDVALVVIAILLGYAFVPAEARVIVGLIPLVVPEFYYFVIQGETDITWVLPMIVVAALWDESPVWAALWLGVACALKQDPWFIVPFALMHWRSWRPAAVFAGAFLLPNLPFISWNPQAWLHGVFAPLVAHPIPDGVGFVQLMASHMIPPLALFLGLPWILCFGLCLLAYERNPKKLHWLPFLAPAFVLFFAPRSLVSYFLYWPLIAIVYALRRSLAAAVGRPVRSGARANVTADERGSELPAGEQVVPREPLAPDVVGGNTKVLGKANAKIA